MPAARTTRLSEFDHERLQRLARETGKSQVEILKSALDIFEREHLLEAMNAGFAELRSDPKAWAAELEERALWERTTEDRGQDS